MMNFTPRKRKKEADCAFWTETARSRGLIDHCNSVGVGVPKVDALQM